MKRKKIVVVLGMHRSGTSALTCGLQALGVSLGDHLLPAALDNGKGFWEDLDVIALNTEMLSVVGRDWRSLLSITDQDVDMLYRQGYGAKCIQLLAAKASAVSVFGFKDPRTTKLLPFWRRVFEDPSFDVKYLLASRNPLSVVRSLAKRDKFPNEISYVLWLEYMLAALCNVGAGNALLVDYDALVCSPRDELKRVADWLGLALIKDDFEKYCGSFIEQTLRHSHFGRDDVFADDAALPLVKDVYAFLLDVQAGKTSLEAGLESGLFQGWRDRLDRMQPLLRLIDRRQVDIEKAYGRIADFERNERMFDKAFGRAIGVLRKVKGFPRKAEFFIREHLPRHAPGRS